MHCPTCGSPLNEGDAFCGSCGAPVGAAQSAQAQPTQPMPQPQPTQPAQQPTQVMPQAQPYATPQPAAAAPPVPGRKTGLIITLSVVGALLVVGLLVGGYFAFKAFTTPEEPVPTATSDTSTPAVDTSEPATPATPSGFATAEEALAEALPTDWVSAVSADDGDVIEYIIGPPNSEYVDVVVVARQPDGSWLVEETYAIENDMTSDSGMTAEDEAIQVVGEFIYAVKEDRADDAHTYTISPFSEDPASASYSNGDLTSFEITDAQLQSDGSTVWVWSSERWAWGTEVYIYVCVPTADGYRISELRLP